MKKNILIASNLYKPNIGGVENSLWHLAENFRSQGHSVIIFASDISRLNLPLPLIESENRITVMRYKVAQYKGIRRYFMHWINGIRVLNEIKKTHNPDLVIARFHITCLMLSLSGYKQYVYIVPGVVKFQNTFLKNTKGLFKKIKGELNYRFNVFLQNQALKRCEKVYVFSQNMVEQVTSMNTNIAPKVSLVKPGVNLDRFTSLDTESKATLRNSLGLSVEGPVFLCIGRVVKDKGFDLAIKAMKKLPSAKLWLIGDGEELNSLKHLANELGVCAQVNFVGATNTPESYFSAADYFIMSSRYEPLGQTILEALACGLPIVAFKNNQFITTATQELLGEHGAFYAEDPTSEALSSAISQAMHCSTYQAIAAQNRSLAKQKFSWETLCNQLLVGLDEH